MMGRPTLSAATKRIRPAVFAELQARIDRVVAAGAELLPLHIGDTHLLPPEGARRVLANLDADDATLHRYGATSGLGALREAVAKSLTKRGLSFDPAHEILIGNGGTHALYCAARSVLDEGDEVIVCSPYWPLAPGVFGACGAITVEVPLTQDLYREPSIDFSARFAQATSPRTKAIYFISPNNPDGKVLGRAHLEIIAAFARAHDLWVFADEVYSDVDYGADADRVHSIASLPEMRDRTILLHSLSKSHALAGLRVGFVAAHADVVAAARRVSTHTAFNVSVAMQRAAIAALEDDGFPRTARETYLAARDATVSALQGAPITFHVPEGATYLFLDFSGAISLRGDPKADRPLYDILERAIDRGVLLAPGDAFGRAYTSCARLCFTAVPSARVVEGAERLREAVLAYVEDKA